MGFQVLTTLPGYEDSLTGDSYDGYDSHRPPSPPHASGGAYYGPPPAEPAPGTTAFTQGFTQHPNVATTNINEAYRPVEGYRPYNPQDYSSYPPPPPGPPPPAATPTGMPPPPTGGHRAGPSDPDPAHVSSESSSSYINANINTREDKGKGKVIITPGHYGDHVGGASVVSDNDHPNPNATTNGQSQSGRQSRQVQFDSRQQPPEANAKDRGDEVGGPSTSA